MNRWKEDTRRGMVELRVRIRKAVKKRLREEQCCCARRGK